MTLRSVWLSGEEWSTKNGRETLCKFRSPEIRSVGSLLKSTGCNGCIEKFCRRSATFQVTSAIREPPNEHLNRSDASS